MNPLRPQPRPPKREKRVPKPLRKGKPPARGKAPRKVRKTSRGKMGRLADKLFSLIVRARGECEWHVVRGQRWSDCTGALQCAHVCSRRYRSTRWDEANAMPLCAGAHMKFTHDPLAFEEFVGAGQYDLPALKRKALGRWDGDIDGVLVRLAARAVSMKLIPEKEI